MSMPQEEKAQLVHENLGIMMTYAYSLKPLAEELTRSFAGSHKYLEKSLISNTQRRAIRACMELALFLRSIDDDIQLTKTLERNPDLNDCGTLYITTDRPSALTLREVANKIIHAEALEWHMVMVRTNEGYDIAPAPILACWAPKNAPIRWPWVRAEVNLIKLAAVCGQIAF